MRKSCSTDNCASQAFVVCLAAWLATACIVVALGAWVLTFQRAAAIPLVAMALGLVASGAGLTALAGLRRAQRRSLRELADADELAARALEMLDQRSAAGAPQNVSAGPLTERLDTMIARLGQMLEEHRQREREVLRSDQLALVGQMAAGVAHEIRNPLTSIKMLVQSGQKEGAASDLSDEDLRVIEQEIRRMERCLQRFLDFARPPRPEQRPLDMVPLLEQTFALVEGRARKQRVELRLDTPREPILVNADRDQLQQLVLNLVLNALDVMPNGGELAVGLTKPNDREIELRVQDTGPGIPAELMPRLFDPFVSTKETGVGLGLAVSYRIAERHAGRLSADSDRPPGEGACLVLRLPALHVSETMAR